MRFAHPLALFILASGGIHAAALALAPQNPAPGQVASSLRVTLATSNASRPRPPQPVAATAPSHSQPPVRRHTTQPPRRLSAASSTSREVRTDTTSVSPSRQTSAGSRTRHEQMRTTQLRHTTASPAVYTAASLAQRRNHIRTRLQRELATFFRYPYVARRRGWHGRVVLDVSIMPSGRIGRVAVQQSSGHAVLDEAALTAMHRITRLDWAPALLQGDAVEIQLPVIYRLLGG